LFITGITHQVLTLVALMLTRIIRCSVLCESATRTSVRRWPRIHRHRVPRQLAILRGWGNSPYDPTTCNRPKANLASAIGPAQSALQHQQFKAFSAKTACSWFIRVPLGHIETGHFRSRESNRCANSKSHSAI